MLTKYLQVSEGIIILFLIIYFIPAIIATLRGKSNTLAIFALNFFLGWTFIGWVVSLVWSLTKDNKPQTILIDDNLSTKRTIIDNDKKNQPQFGQLLAVVFLMLFLFGLWRFFLKKDIHKTPPKQEAIKISRHSREFNQSVSDAVNNYLTMKDAFVDADTIKIKINGQKFIATIDTLKLHELQKDDSTILLAAQQEVSDIKANAEAMVQENTLTEMREDFRMVSENLYPFLKTIGYEGPKLYWQNCPVAFGENKEGNWLSSTSEIMNPYLGKNSPFDTSAIPRCGETKDSLR